MKNVIIFTTLFFFTLTSFSQNKKDLTISLSAGRLNSPYFKKANASNFYGFDIDYHLSKRHLFSVNYIAGGHNYFEDVLSNEPNSVIYSDGTNAKADYRTFSVLYKYKVLNTASLSVVPGIGAGIMTITRDYPWQAFPSSYSQTSSYSDLVFPVSLDINFKVSKHWQAGMTGGFLLIPEYPVLALHAGPRLSYVIK